MVFAGILLVFFGLAAAAADLAPGRGKADSCPLSGSAAGIYAGLADAFPAPFRIIGRLDLTGNICCGLGTFSIAAAAAPGIET